MKLKMKKVSYDRLIAWFNLSEVFKLYEYDGWHYWLEREDGSGMPIKKASVLSFLVNQLKDF